MPLNKSQRESYLMIDHRASPGVPGVPKFLEQGVYSCKHCQRQVVREPGKDKHWCSGCDNYICNRCEVLRKIEGCVTWESIMERQARMAGNITLI